MKTKKRGVLYWCPDSVRYHDIENGKWTEHRPVSEIGALVWCVANGVEFQKVNRGLVSVGEVLGGQKWR